MAPIKYISIVHYIEVGDVTYSEVVQNLQRKITDIRNTYILTYNAIQHYVRGLPKTYSINIMTLYVIILQRNKSYFV